MANQKIEDTIRDVLKGDAQKNALDFVAYLRENEIPIEESEHYWDIKYRGHSVCFLFINGSEQAPGPWTIWSDQEPGTWVAWPVGDDEGLRGEFPVDERIRKLAWANVNSCTSCGGDCSPGTRKSVLGKPFDNLCGSAIAFTDPDTDALDCAKKMVDMRKKDILCKS